MSELTPTTEEVREYLTRVQGTGSSLAQAQAEAIGLWFDKYVIAERQRVTKMATERALVDSLGFDDILTLIKHHPTEESIGGLLGVCSCGEPVDDFINHVKEQR